MGGIIGGGTGGGAEGLSPFDEVGGVSFAGGGVKLGGNGISSGRSAGEAAFGAAS